MDFSTPTVALLFGLVAGVMQQFRHGRLSSPGPSVSTAVDPDDPAIHWLALHPRRRAYIILPGVLIVPMMLLLGASSVSKLAATDGDATALLVPLIAITVAMFMALLALISLYRIRVGVLGDAVIIRKGRKHAAAAGKDILLSEGMMVVGDLAAPMNRGISLFQYEDVVRRLYPSLRQATVLEQGALATYLLRRRREQLISAMFVVVLAGAVVAAFAGLVSC